MKLGDILVKQGVVTGAQLEAALAAQKGSGERVGQALIRLGHAGDAYTEQLRETFEKEQPPERLPGATQLCERLDSERDATQGLLTGNYAETGRLKVQAAGYDLARFQVCAWGSDADSRRALVPIALARYAELRGSTIDPDRVVIVGDTPHDIDCAKANGCRSIAVATGTFSLADLRAEKPDLALKDLTGTAAVLGFLGLT